MSGHAYWTVLVRQDESISVHGLFRAYGVAEQFATRARNEMGVQDARAVEIYPATVREVELAASG